jgi:hypothetical protein
LSKPLDALARYAHVAGYLGDREWLLYERTEDSPSSTRQREWIGQAVARGQQPAIESKCLQNKFRKDVSSFLCDMSCERTQRTRQTAGSILFIEGVYIDQFPPLYQSLTVNAFSIRGYDASAMANGVPRWQ